MARLGDLVVAIGGNTRELDKALGKSMRKIKSFGKNTKKLGKDLTMNVTAPIAALGFTAVRAFQQQAKAIAQVEAGLQSTGATVGYTSQQLQQMASDLQSKTLFGDEQILQEATSQLLTFTNITGQQFARTQQAALDLATRLDGDLKGASIQLGKALNDPVANLSALSRSGIQFSDEQKAVIKSMAETGRLAEAQTLILDELNKQYGGSAEAAAKADGGFTQLANSFGDLQEEFGKILVEVLQPVVNYFRELIDRLNDTSPRFKQIAVTVSLVAAAVGPLLMIIPTLAQGFMTVRMAMIALNTTMLANPFALVATAIALVVTGIIAMTGEAEKATTAVDDLKKANEGLTKAEKERNIVEAMAKQKELVAQLKEERDEKQKLVDQGYGGKAIKDAREANEAYSEATKELSNMSNELFMLDADGRMKELAKDTKEVAKNVEKTSQAIDKSKTLGFLFGGLEEQSEEVQTERGMARAEARDAVPTIGSLLGEQDAIFFESQMKRAEQAHADAMDAMKQKQDEFNNAVNQLAGTLQSQFSNLFTGLMNGTQTFGEFMKQILMDLLVKLASMVAAFLVISALTGGAAGTLGGFLTEGFGLGGLIPMASGGIVSGPTAILAGEYGGARTNPEVIAPLDKLQSMIQGSGGGNVTVTGRISGSDILLSSERSNIYRNRVRGF